MHKNDTMQHLVESLQQQLLKTPQAQVVQIINKTTQMNTNIMYAKYWLKIVVTDWYLPGTLLSFFNYY